MMVAPLTAGGTAQGLLMRVLPALACRIYCRVTPYVVTKCSHCA